MKEKRVIGFVNFYNEEQKYGLIEYNKEKYFFGIEDVENQIKLAINTKVTFVPVQKINGKKRARNIRQARVYNKNIKNILEEIKQWKLEAKLEDNEKYFYPISELKSIEEGNKCFGIGRKGTGKTAISEYLVGQSKNQYNYFTQQLSFKNFPFNDLYKLNDPKYTQPSQYITIWKFIIYSSIASQMMNNEQINIDLRNELKKIYENKTANLGQTISHWTSGSFGVNIWGHAGATLGASKNSTDNKTSWIDKVSILEEIISNNIDDSHYFIIFDELDEDYKSDENKPKYLALLTGLFKAVQDVKSIFKSSQYNIKPIVFLRNDIYSQIKDSDKTKWSDVIVKLSWESDTIKQMLQHRLSKLYILSAIKNPTFDKLWTKIFSDKYIRTKQGYNIEIFDHITAQTFLRPRDYIQYLKSCSEIAIDKGGYKINTQIRHSADYEFSNYLRSEIEDEIIGILPDIQELLNIISHIRKVEFKFAEFNEKYLDYAQNNNIENPNAEYILKVLFDFSVIGNVAKANHKELFKYKNANAGFNITESIKVHKGLLKALQIS